MEGALRNSEQGERISKPLRYKHSLLFYFQNQWASNRKPGDFPKSLLPLELRVLFPKCLSMLILTKLIISKL